MLYGQNEVLSGNLLMRLTAEIMAKIEGEEGTLYSIDLLRGIASLIETTITSPTDAYFRLEPPSTLMHITRRAPELSATSRVVCI